MLNDAAYCLAESVVNSENGMEYLENSKYETYFVVNEFTGTIFDNLRKKMRPKSVRIIGPTVLIQLMNQNRPLPVVQSPLYTLCMENVVVVFSGFEDKKDEMIKLSDMILAMGGNVREKIDETTTHLVATCCQGEKYRCAQKAKLPIMKGEWVVAWWEMKDIISWSDTFTKKWTTDYKLQPFYGAKICFHGFDKEDEEYCYFVLNKYGGERAQFNAQDCTHIVVADNANLLPSSNTAFTVNKEWFWKSITSEARLDEKEYLFVRCNESENEATVSVNITQPAAADVKQKLSKRLNVFTELIESETDYVSLLGTIITQFKSPLENLIKNKNTEILSSFEIKMIFSNFSLLYTTHKELLKKLIETGRQIVADADNADYTKFSKIFIHFEPIFLAIYAAFVNRFEITNAVFEILEKNNSKFAAFVKKCQELPEYKRQSLKELLIKPIQRLPSISLLLNRIFDYTDKSSPDYYNLQAAVFSIEQVLTNINEGKRNIDLHVMTLTMFNKIDNCPPNLLWSNRKFFNKTDVIEITNGDIGRGDCLTLFLFTDCIVICKKNSSNHSKPYECIKIINLKKIRKVVAVLKENEGNKLFTLILRAKPDELKDHYLTFKFLDDTIENLHFLYRICKLAAYVTHTPDPVTKFHVCKFDYIKYNI